MRASIVGALVVLGLVPAAWNVSDSSAHNDPCHSRQTCPSDDHSYVWSGMSCTSDPAQRLPEDQMPIVDRGVRYWCHVVTDQGMTPGGSQGRSRRARAIEQAVRTLSDRRAASVRPRVTETTVARLAALPRPSTPAARGRGAESTRYRVAGTLVSAIRGRAGELRLVLADPGGHGWIAVRLPAARCTGSATPAGRAAMALARASVLRSCGALPAGRTVRLGGSATVTGIGFFAAQPEGGSNGFALAPVLRFAASRCARV
jgi:hypothetical protein